MNVYNPKRAAKPRKPLRTLAELAEDYGVKLGQLMHAYVHAEVKPPKPNLITGRVRWFCQDLMRAWWNEIGGAESCVSPRAEYNAAWRQKMLAGQSALTAPAQ